MANKRSSGRPENLKGFAKGADPRRNPGGRPRAFREYLRGLIGEGGEHGYDRIWEIAQGLPVERKEKGATGKDKRRLVYPSIGEMLEALKFLDDKLNGKAVQALEHSGSIELDGLTDEQLEARFCALLAKGAAEK